MELTNPAATGGARRISAPHETLRRKARPLLPSQDPFCQPPTGYQHAAPGTVLRSREVELAFLGLIPQRFTATQLLYRTVDRNGAPEATVTTVLVPAGLQPGQTCPVLSYQCAIDAVAASCFPSYALRRRAKALGAPVQAELVPIATALAQGWAVSVPDHEGPNGTWVAPYEPGYRALDGVRAAMSAEHLGLSAKAPVGLWGYSGGGLATAWAAEMSAEYAPELNVVGAVLGSPSGDVGRALRRLDGTFFTGLCVVAVAGLMRTYPHLDRVIREHVNEKGRAVLRRAETMTTNRTVLRLARKKLDNYLDRPLDEMLAMPEVQHVFDDIKLGTAVPASPVLIVQAAHDYLVDVDDIDVLADAYVAGGANVTYHRDMFSGHMLLAALSVPIALRWLSERFAGRPLTDQLITTKWPAMFTPADYPGMARLAVIAAKVLTGRSVCRRRPLSRTETAVPQRVRRRWRSA